MLWLSIKWKMTREKRSVKHSGVIRLIAYDGVIQEGL